MQPGEGCWLHCLGLAGELLQRVPNKAVRLPAANSALIGLPDLARRLFSPAMQQGSAPVRCSFTCCIAGSVAMAAPSSEAYKHLSTVACASYLFWVVSC